MGPVRSETRQGCPSLQLMFIDNTLDGQTTSPRSSPGSGRAKSVPTWLSVLLLTEGAARLACASKTEDPLWAPHKPWSPERTGSASSHACPHRSTPCLAIEAVLRASLQAGLCLLLSSLPTALPPLPSAALETEREKDTWQVSCKHLSPVCLSASLPPRHGKLLVDKWGYLRASDAGITVINEDDMERHLRMAWLFSHPPTCEERDHCATGPWLPHPSKGPETLQPCSLVVGGVEQQRIAKSWLWQER